MIKNLQAKVDAFHEAALFLKDKIENGGWKKFRSNYLREHCACRFGIGFSNSDSPAILDELRKQHPEVARWVVVHARKEKDAARRSKGGEQHVWTF